MEFQNREYALLRRESPLPKATSKLSELRQRVQDAVILSERPEVPARSSATARQQVTALRVNEAQQLRVVQADVAVEGALRYYGLAPFEPATVATYKQAKVVVELDAVRARGQSATANWKMTPLSLYEESMPPAAQNLALALSSDLPGAEFFVDHLVVTVEAWKGDPFLVIRYLGQDYYLYVWNEPGFLPKAL